VTIYMPMIPELPAAMVWLLVALSLVMLVRCVIGCLAEQLHCKCMCCLLVYSPTFPFSVCSVSVHIMSGLAIAQAAETL
jgi:hypothetical protein